MNDLRYAVRMLRRNPLFALTASLSVAIGIGATTTIFTVANSLLRREPVGMREPGRLVDIGVTRNGVGFSSGSYPNYIDISRRVTTLDGVYAHPRFPERMSLEGAGGEVTIAFATEVSVNYFAVLGAVPAAGRLLDPADATESGDAVAVLSDRFWTRRFNRDATIVGQPLRLNGRSFTIVGVAAAGFRGPACARPTYGCRWYPRFRRRRATSTPR